MPIVAIGNGNPVLKGVSDLAATSFSGSASSASNSENESQNIGTGSVLITSTLTGQSNIYSGKVSNNNFPYANVNNLVGQEAYKVNNLDVASGVLNTAISETNSANANLNKIFSKLPSLADVDNIILTSDSVSLLKLIQSVGTDSTISCDKRIAYLL